MLRFALWAALYLIWGGALVAINWLIWFKLVPLAFRNLRDQPGWKKLWRARR